MSSQLKRTLRVLEQGAKRTDGVSRESYRPRAVRRRLGEDTIREMLGAYRQGATSPELVATYGGSKEAVLNILHEQGLARRKPGLTKEQVAGARELRLQGLSYDAIGIHFDVFGSTVWRALNPKPMVQGPKPRQLQRRLSGEQVSILVRDYQNGASSTELAER